MIKSMDQSKKEVLQAMALEFVCLLAALYAVFCWDQFVDTGKIVWLASLKPSLCWAAAATAIYFGLNEFMSRTDEHSEQSED